MLIPMKEREIGRKSDRSKEEHKKYDKETWKDKKNSF